MAAHRAKQRKPPTLPKAPRARPLGTEPTGCLTIDPRTGWRCYQGTGKHSHSFMAGPAPAYPPFVDDRPRCTDEPRCARHAGHPGACLPHGAIAETEGERNG